MYKVELPVRLVSGQEVAIVEFRNTLAPTGKTLCRLFLRVPPRRVSVSYHYELKHFK